ncbi:MAG: DNA/RNA nuclease SfsA [Candidatus Marinimicrobia bacterium]|nr:DNA/RNA nuclease SfsA [Candidatus Neomarinimicrobiota bacterium]
MPLTQGLIEAKFLARPNRFLSQVEINGEVHDAHVPDPGRLKELLFPGARVLVEPKSGPERKTRFATVMVYAGDELVSINSQLPNRFVRYCLDRELIPEFSGWSVKKQEFTLGASRFDFLLGKDDREKLLEVKSASLVEQHIARFPDAVTARGTKHIEHLVDSMTDKRSAAVLFIVQRSDAGSFEPHWERDPKFSQALTTAVAQGLELFVYTTLIQRDGMSLMSRIPYDLEKHG